MSIIQEKIKQVQAYSAHSRTLTLVNEVAESSKKLGIAHRTIEDKNLDGRTITLNKEKSINFGSCSYMGLETDERLITGAIDAVRRYGSQFASSRAYLSVALYQEIEELLAQIFEAPIILGPTVTLCHQSNIPVLVGDKDAVILDYQVHECVQTAVSLLKLRGIHVETVRHNNMEALEKRIQQLGASYAKIWYMADGVYSMLGDFAPMQPLHYLLNKYEQFNLYIDDAHGMSWAGKNGAGFVKSQLWHHERMYLVTSIAKSFAACGGVMVYPNESTRNLVKNCGPTMIFSGPIQPPVLGSAIASAKIHLSEEIYLRQEELQNRIQFFNQKAKALDLPLIGSSDSPVFFIGTGKPEAGYEMVQKIMKQGFYINLSVFPSVSINQTGLRIPITLHHTFEDIENLLHIIAKELPLVLDKHAISYKTIYRAFKLPYADKLANSDKIGKYNSKY